MDVLVIYRGILTSLDLPQRFYNKDDHIGFQRTSQDVALPITLVITLGLHFN